MQDKRITTREFLRLAGVTIGGAFLLKSSLNKKDIMAQPTEQEKVLEKISELNFVPGSHLRTTLVPRKQMYEMAQAQKMLGNWPQDKDPSDWQGNPNLMDENLSFLESVGVRGGRLAVFSFEVTKDGKEYDWQPMDTAIDMMSDHGMPVDLSLGPINYPTHPGARVPKKIEEQLKQEFSQRGQNHIHVSLEPDPNMPDSSQTLRDFSLRFFASQLEEYNKDERVEKFYFGNEWPDTNGIEGIPNATLSFGQDLMLELINMAKSLTKKEIVFNTNIYPSNLKEVEAKLGPVLKTLDKQGTIGIDSYWTEEEKNFFLRMQTHLYGESVDKIRAAFPQTQIIFTELQAEPWPPTGLEGQSWAQIFTQQPDLIKDYFEQQFPRTLESHVIPSDIKEIGLWGAPLWPVLATLNYDFPARMMKTIADTMARA